MQLVLAARLGVLKGIATDVVERVTKGKTRYEQLDSLLGSWVEPEFDGDSLLHTIYYSTDVLTSQVAFCS